MFDDGGVMGNVQGNVNYGRVERLAVCWFPECVDRQCAEMELSIAESWHSMMIRSFSRRGRRLRGWRGVAVF